LKKSLKPRKPRDRERRRGTRKKFRRARTSSSRVLQKRGIGNRELARCGHLDSPGEKSWKVRNSRRRRTVRGKGKEIKSRERGRIVGSLNGKKCRGLRRFLRVGQGVQEAERPAVHT